MIVPSSATPNARRARRRDPPRPRAVGGDLPAPRLSSRWRISLRGLVRPYPYALACGDAALLPPAARGGGGDAFRRVADRVRGDGDSSGETRPRRCWGRRRRPRRWRRSPTSSGSISRPRCVTSTGSSARSRRSRRVLRLWFADRAADRREPGDQRAACRYGDGVGGRVALAAGVYAAERRGRGGRPVVMAAQPGRPRDAEFLVRDPARARFAVPCAGRPPAAFPAGATRLRAFGALILPARRARRRPGSDSHPRHPLGASSRR